MQSSSDQSAEVLSASISPGAQVVSAPVNQTRRMLAFASKTLTYMRSGLSYENCNAVCRLLLPETQAMAVAMTDDAVVLGYAGRHAEYFPVGSPIHTEATHRVLASQTPEFFENSPDATGVDALIPAGVVAPLVVRKASVGTLKLYYESADLVDDTQRAIAEGLADLLSTQLATSELDRQAELAAKAELHALQSQINPHFLFNTINAIASLIRTDPISAREMLRGFATFYRQTLENSSDLISLQREIEQTERYLSFEVVRFGAQRVMHQIHIADGLETLCVPAFIMQPVVENAVNHAMPVEGTLHITVEVYARDQDVYIEIVDDGVGMEPSVAADLISNAAPSDKGTGIALRNVSARLKACFAPGSGVTISSAPGKGTRVLLALVGALDSSD